MMNESDLLESFAFLAPFSPKQRLHIAGRARKKSVAAGEAVFHAGDLSETMYLIVQGQVKITRNDEQGEEVALGLLGNGQAFGELAMLSGEPRMATAVALTPCEFLIIDRPLMAEAIADATPEGILQLFGVFSQQIRATNEREFQDLLAKRTQALTHEIQQLRMEIDESKKQKQVEEIVDSDFFQHVQSRARDLRERRQRGASTSAKGKPKA